MADRGAGDEAGRVHTGLSSSCITLTARANLPKGRIARLPVIATETLSGRYFECSNGWLSIARDLIDRRRNTV